MTNLATFVDRHTMKHIRIFPHPVDRVWRAITDDQEFSEWFGIVCTFDMRPGGRCVFGPADEPYFETEITRFDPKTLVEHNGVQDHPTGLMRFELSPHTDGTRFEFTQKFTPGQTWGEVDELGGDLPGGVDTPWRPGFVGGWHAFFDMLGNYLDGAFLERGHEPSDRTFGLIVDNWLDQQVHKKEFTREDADRYARGLRAAAYWEELNGIYRKHIRETIPPA